MNVFDIIGPIMIGPSSSHTAGAVRIGSVVNKIMNEQKPESVEVTLSGSFAQTYKGHGTDRAIMAGIMGFDSASEEIKNALEIASERGIKYSFIRKISPGPIQILPLSASPCRTEPQEMFWGPASAAATSEWTR